MIHGCAHVPCGQPAIAEKSGADRGGVGIGLRNAALLESVLDRPRNLLAYEPQASMYQLAAALCVGIAKNHRFNDGNRRTALLAMRAFPYLNAQALEPSQADEVAILVAVADGSRTEQSLAP